MGLSLLWCCPAIKRIIMKATELKLGDWVCFRNPETGKKKTVRITAIINIEG